LEDRDEEEAAAGHPAQAQLEKIQKRGWRKLSALFFQ
jgi:hypothetical protein